MISYVVKTYNFHVCNMFDEILVMASRGLV